MLSYLLSKSQLNASLMLINDSWALSSAHKEGHLEEFVSSAICVFIRLGKVKEGFSFLASVETIIEDNSAAYSQGIKNLVEHVVTLSKSEIERKFL